MSKITTYNPKIQLTSLRTNNRSKDDNNFYMQLTNNEKCENNFLEVQVLKSRIEMLYNQIALNDFRIDRNHPDPDLYRTDSMSDLPNVEYIEYLEEKVKELETQSKSIKCDCIDSVYCVDSDEIQSERLN